MNALLIALTMYSGGVRLPLSRMINSPIIQEKLNLTDSQIQKIRSVWYPAEETLIDLRAKRNKIRLRIREEISKDNVDFGRLQKLFDELSKVNSRIGLTRTKMMVSVKGILTKDQIIKLREMRENRIKRIMMRKRKFRVSPHVLSPLNR